MESFLFQHSSQLKLKDPLIVAMCDTIEDYLEFDEEYEESFDILTEEETAANLPLIRQILISSQNQFSM